jgi:signal peptidase I
MSADDGEMFPPPETPRETRTGRPKFAWLRELFETLLPAVLIAILINLFLAQATRVYGQSMEPNLHTDQRLVVEKLSYRMHGPERGDIVVLKLDDRQGELLIKRVIGLSGERVAIRDGRVYVDGRAIEESYLAESTPGMMPAQIVPPLHVFVLGDNRGASNDSRSFGMVPLDNVIGKAWVSYWPLQELRVIQ